MSIFFKNRDGQTPLEDSVRKGLIPTHVNDMTELYEYEIENIALGIEWIKKTKKNHRDYLTWLEVHKHMLSKVWVWAGKFRTRELANIDFLMPYNVGPELILLQDNFIYWVENRSFEEKQLIASFHERLLTIHPFNDGNGRWSRLLTNMISEREGFRVPSWGVSIIDDEERRSRYILAVKKARHEGTYLDLIDFMYL